MRLHNICSIEIASARFVAATSMLRALFNAPLVCLVLADRFIAGRGVSQDLAWWSYSARFADFGRGVISLANVAFFLLVTAFGIYLSMLLIGRRHWMGGRDGQGADDGHDLAPIDR